MEGCGVKGAQKFRVLQWRSGVFARGADGFGMFGKFRIGIPMRPARIEGCIWWP